MKTMNYIHSMDSQLDLNQLRTFFTLVQAGSFSETARRLHRTQSAVSHAIRKLEDLAGVVLVDRRVRDLRLTDEGRRLYQACESVFATLDGVCEDFQRGRSLSLGRIRLGSTIELGCHVLMRQMGVFLERNPGIEIDFTLSPTLLEPLLRDDLDMAIDCVEHFRPELQKTPLFREIYAVACSPAFLKDHGIKVPGDLSRCPILSQDKSGGWWHRFMLTLPEGQRPELRRIIAVNHIRGMVHAAVHGLGVVLAPQYSVQGELDRGELVSLFASIRSTEDRFYRFFLYQKTNKAGLEKHRRLTDFLQTIQMSELEPS
jgi:DNA-binding transcriptional LysR family regulator